VIARITGILILVMAVGGFAGFGILDALVVPGDASATAGRILASKGLFQLGFVGNLVAFLCDVPVAILLYVLLRPAGRTLALVAAAFRLVYAAIVGANLINPLGATLLLGGAGYLSAFGTSQLQGAALFLLTLYKHGFSLALVFFAFHLLLLGVLLDRSSSFPRFLGVLMVIAGCAYLTDSLSLLLIPAFNAKVAPFLAVPMSFELVLAVWLLVKGVKVQPTAD
jgi:hypothetical protein